LSVELVDLGTATLDQNNQHDGKQNASYYANQSNAVHGEILLGLTAVEGMPRLLTSDRLCLA
jgi:hypothetical protein